MLPSKFPAQHLKAAQIGAALPQYPLGRRQARVQPSQQRCSHGPFSGASLASSTAQFGGKCMLARRGLLVAIAQAPLAVAMAVQSGRPAAAEPVEAPQGDECVMFPHPFPSGTHPLASCIRPSHACVARRPARSDASCPASPSRAAEATCRRSHAAFRGCAARTSLHFGPAEKISSAAAILTVRALRSVGEQLAALAPRRVLETAGEEPEGQEPEPPRGSRTPVGRQWLVVLRHGQRIDEARSRRVSALYWLVDSAESSSSAVLWRSPLQNQQRASEPYTLTRKGTWAVGRPRSQLLVVRPASSKRRMH